MPMRPPPRRRGMFGGPMFGGPRRPPMRGFGPPPPPPPMFGYGPRRYRRRSGCGCLPLFAMALPIIGLLVFLL